MTHANNPYLYVTVAIVVRFLTRRFIIEYEHGADTRYKHEMLIDNELVVFDLLDTSSSITSNVNVNVNSHQQQSAAHSSINNNNSNQVPFDLTARLVCGGGTTGPPPPPCDVLLLIYSICDRVSFTYVRSLLTQLFTLRGE